MTENDVNSVHIERDAPVTFADLYHGDMNNIPVFADRNSRHYGGTLSRRPNWKPTVKQPLPSIPCDYTRRDGEPCTRMAIQGSGNEPDSFARCAYHGGGNLPNVRAKADRVRSLAAMSLLDHTEDAVQTIAELMQAADTDAVRLNAAKDLLDRVGLKSAVEVNVTVEDNRQSATERLKEKLASLRGNESDLEDLGESEEIIEAEEVSDD